MHKVFISYHHANDQEYKEALLRKNKIIPIFIDGSVDTGDISDELDDESIRQKIRDEYLKDTTVTVLLVGTETKNRKHIDWELYSSMYDGKVNKKSGVLVITLPSTGCTYFTAGHGDAEKNLLYQSTTSWMSIDSKAEYERRYPYLPDRIIDNLLASGAKVSVTNWSIIERNWKGFEFLINVAHDDKGNCDYDLSRPMKKKNS